jgi:hypothetical protein
MRHLRMFFSSAPIPGTWFKLLNPDYTQKHERREMFDAFHMRNGRSSVRSVTPVLKILGPKRSGVLRPFRRILTAVFRQWLHTRISIATGELRVRLAIWSLSMWPRCRITRIRLNFQSLIQKSQGSGTTARNARRNGRTFRVQFKLTMALRPQRTLSLIAFFDALDNRPIKHAINFYGEGAQIGTWLKR